MALAANLSQVLGAVRSTSDDAAAVALVRVGGAAPAALVAGSSSGGLLRDRDVVSGLLRAAGWAVEVVKGDVRLGPGSGHAAVVHLERPSPSLLGRAVQDVVVPNLEWWDVKWTPALVRAGTTVWAKTEAAAAAFEAMGARVRRVGFRSLDRLDAAVARERVFLHVGGLSEGKRTATLVATWRSGWPELVVVSPRADVVRATAAPNVRVLPYLKDTALRRLQNKCVFHLYPSRYEGFGHALWEGLSCGAVVFATDAVAASWDPSPFLPLASSAAGRSRNGLVELRDVLSESLAVAAGLAAAMSDADLAARAEASRRAWECGAADFAARGAEAIRALAAPSTPIRVVVEPLMKEVSTPPPPLPLPPATATRRRVVVLHSPLERCGIAEYGRQLDVALIGAGVSPESTTLRDEAAVARLGGGDVALVHFELAIVPWGLAAALAAARGRGARVVFVCHYFDEAIAARFDAAVDVFVVHREYVGDCPKLRVLPLGCPVYEPFESRVYARARLGLPADAVVLSTVGLLSPWKRFPDLARALVAARRDRPRVFLQFLTPAVGPQSAAHAAELAQVLGVPDVYFSTEFRPERDLLDRVYASDLGVLYHAQDTGSVSAATKQFVSARTPLVVTGSSHASDLLGGVVRVDGFDPADLAAAAAALASDAGRLQTLRDEAGREYARLNMNEVARRLAEVL